MFLNGELFDQGRMTLEQIVAKLDTGAAERDADGSTPRSPSRCSSSAAAPPARPPLYAARKGIRTGVAAERFGGQVLDTMAIENFLSVEHTEGPRMAGDLERQVRGLGVEVVTGQSAERLVPASEVAGCTEVHLASGAVLR